MTKSSPGLFDTVDYQSLDKAKLCFIDAGRRTLKFAERFGFVPDGKMGASANIFRLDLRPFLKAGQENLYITLLPEGLGTADDARPDDLTSAELESFWFNIGIKTVSVLTNDAASSGLQTILIGLYLPSSTPESVFTPQFMRGFLDGLVEGCRQVGCVYFSGETPQLKTKIYPDRLDIAGALFGLLPAGIEPIDNSKLGDGDHIVLVESSGPHENGFTTLRQIAGKLSNGYRTKLPSGQEYWQAINAPSKLYTGFVQKILMAGLRPTNVENITGHGWQKLMRSAQPLRYHIHTLLPVPEIFSYIQTTQNMSALQMLQIFNYGAGMAVFFRDTAAAEQAVQIAAASGLKAVSAGKVQKSNKREVVVEPMNIVLSGDEFALKK